MSVERNNPQSYGVRGLNVHAGAILRHQQDTALPGE